MKRIFLVGMGPSLDRETLETIFENGDVSFAMNRTELIFDRWPDINWKPDYYVFNEALGTFNPTAEGKHDKGNDWKTYVSQQIADPDVQCYIGTKFWQELSPYLADKRASNLHWIATCQKHFEMDVTCADHKPTDWHLPYPCSYGGIMHVAIQLAFMFGYDPIYLVGCDLGYKPVHPLIKADPNHFHPEYWTWQWTPIENWDKTLVDMHSICRREIESMGRHIYNATKGGELEVYERVNFDALF